VKTEAFYGAILDEGSPANQPGLMTRLLDEARSAFSPDDESAPWLFRFNQSLADAGERGELLSWCLLWDGVYQAKVEVSLAEANPTSGAALESLGAGSEEARLYFPTGRVVLTSLSRVGEEPPFLTIEPGHYRVRFVSDGEEEAKHAFLEAVGDYPPGDGPDWRITLQRLAGR
jgi:hypothetical protein